MNTCRLPTVLSLTLSVALAFLAGCGSPEAGPAAKAPKAAFTAQKGAIAAPTCAAAADCNDAIACTVDACDPIAHVCTHDTSSCPASLISSAPAAEAKISLASNGATGSIDFAFTTINFPLGLSAGKANCYLDGGITGWAIASPYTFTGLAKGLHTLSCVLADTNSGAELGNPEARVTVRVLAIAPCNTIADCDDGNACSDQYCQQGQCVYSVYANCCAGAFECGAGEQCFDQGKNSAKCSQCASAIDCATNDACATPTCDLSGNKGVCTYPKADPECCSSPSDLCDDGKSCTADSCNTDTGKCKHDLIAGTCCSASDCNDNDTCTDDQCVNSKCVHGADSLKPGCCHADSGCSDNNTCTVDKCDVVKSGYTACSHTADATKPNCCNPPLTNCNDGNACTQDECVNFQCQFNAIADCCASDLDCGDANVCTTHTCDLATKKCVKTPLAGCCNADADCGDGKGCTTDICNVGAHTCSHVTAANCCDSAADCSDGKVCTVDACVNGQCINAPNSLLQGCCDTLADCDDDNSCTTDACTANKCVHTAVVGACTPAPVAPKILICPAAQVIPALTTQVLPIKAREVDPTKKLTFKLISAPAYITLPDAQWSSSGAVYVSGLTINPDSGNYAGSDSVSIEISNGGQTSYCNFGVTVTATGGYLIWKPTEVPVDGANAIKASIGKTGAYAQITTDLSLYPDLTQFKGVFVTLGVYGSGTPFHYLNASEAASLKAYLWQQGRLYIEGGDTWADNSNPLAPQFGIIPVASVTADPTGKISGVLTGNNVYTDPTATPPKTSFGFSYDLVDTLHRFNTDIDIIKADSQIGSHALLTNSGGEVLQVAHDGGLYGYRTIGASVLFGGIKAGTDTADAMMVRILNFFQNGLADTPPNGICTPISCTAQDQCHTAGVCNFFDGTCSNPAKANGAACNDGNACTQTDTCQTGTCSGASPVVCSAQDQCHTAGTCNPANGTCSNPHISDGSGCNDGNACTQTDACQAGTCTGTSPVVCSAQDQCHDVGTCNTNTGSCSNPPKSDGSTCSDGNACTASDTCQTGTCTGGAAPNCDDSNACTTDACDAGSGCTHSNVVAGAACTGGTCDGSGTCAAAPAGAITALAVRNATSCAVVGGNLKCWGYNGDGELGDGTTVNKNSPQTVPGYASGAVGVGLGIFHGCGIDSAGALKCWGWNADYELGNGGNGSTTSAVQTAGMTSGVTAVQGGRYMNCAIQNGGVKCWGTSQFLGNNSGSGSATPVAVLGLTSGITAIAAGQYTAFAIDGGGQLWGWGQNFNGGLGTGGGDTGTPVAIPGFASGTKSVSCIDQNTCAVDSAGAVKCWGKGGNGQLGNGSTSDQYAPVQVTGITSGATAVSVSGNHACAIVNGGALCWGGNSNGQLGNGTGTASTTPVQVTGLTSGVTAIAVGDMHTCAIANGSVMCWGYAGYGSLGDGTGTDKYTPVVTIAGSAPAGPATCSGAASYSNTWSTGNRAGLITQSGITGAAGLIDGSYSPFNTDTDAADQYYQFAFPSAIGIAEIKWWYRPSWNSGASGYLGAYKIQASSDGTTFTDISTVYDLGMGTGDTNVTSTLFATDAGSANLKYPYFRLYRTKATGGGAPNEVEIEFKICQ